MQELLLLHSGSASKKLSFAFWLSLSRQLFSQSSHHAVGDNRIVPLSMVII